jgi:hypothetical protein
MRDSIKSDPPFGPQADATPAPTPTSSPAATTPARRNRLGRWLTFIIAKLAEWVVAVPLVLITGGGPAILLAWLGSTAVFIGVYYAIRPQASQHRVGLIVFSSFLGFMLTVIRMNQPY